MRPSKKSGAQTPIQGKMKEISPANIVFATDKGYIAHLAVALCSLFDNNRDLPLNVYVLIRILIPGCGPRFRRSRAATVRSLLI